MQAHQRLHDERIGQQGQQAAEIAGGVEHIGIARPALPATDPGVPGLQQRRGGRKGGERGADRQGELCQQPGHGVVGRAGADGGAEVQRQGQARDSQHDQVDQHLAAYGAQALENVRIAVTQQQRRLEEHQAGVPHRWRAAEARQQQLADHGLQQEHQGRAREHGDGEQCGREAQAGPCGRCPVCHERSLPRESPRASLGRTGLSLG